MTIEVRIGGKYRKMVPNAETAAYIAQDIMDAMDKDVRAQSFRAVELLRRRMERAGNQEIEKITPFITQKLIGLPDQPGGVDIMAVISGGLDGGMVWKELSPRTVRHKIKSGYLRNSYRLFLHTGELRSKMQKANGKLVARTGGVQISYKADYGKKSWANLKERGQLGRDVLGQMIIRIMPKITPYRLHALSTGEVSDAGKTQGLERMLFPSAPEFKLRGPSFPNGGTVNRPLVGPTIAWWAYERIPSLLRKAVANSFQGSRGRL
ncbi:hypothetical protein IZ6_25170 [Terrihabitans soli]|uniref:Uncharacterized protein n=1 Tax=Terrihabitans soli TaxID=708113 RepID=A0A6S6QX05_9HYPH|nr:hypothetical protein [Terrihabitans soli]BCJ91782.1 hypothetical protein IZ6_25170 [Terrihabitans soli]